MPPTYFPLRWESTGDQWWYASPIDWAAANGLYDLVRELLNIDTNLLIKLTSLRRIRRLETVWDDEEQFNDVAKCRSEVAQKLLLECENKKGHNSLIRAGYGGWLVYTAASAGDESFVKELLERDPLLVFGEGEYGVTDIFYAAARSKNSEVFRLLFECSVSSKSVRCNGGELEDKPDEVLSVFRWEMTNRAIHAAARGGSLGILKELLGDGSDVLVYSDLQGSTILHSAAGRGQVEVVKYLLASFDITTSTDNQGNTALHVAAYRGYLAVVEVLVYASFSSTTLTNNYGDTFLHMVVAGFRTPGFRRIDHQIGLLKQLVSGKLVNIIDIVNIKNIEGRTALHMAVENIQSSVVELLMTVPSINLNIRDAYGMTPLDLLKQRPRSVSSEILIKQLASAGGISNCQNHVARIALVSHLKMQGTGISPGTSFRIPDAEIFLYTGIENASDTSSDSGNSEYSTCSSELGELEATADSTLMDDKKMSPVNHAARHLKFLLRWPRNKERKAVGTELQDGDDDSLELLNMYRNLEDNPIPLRQKFSKSSRPSNKRTHSARSNLPSPSTRKRFAAGLMHGVIQATPHLAFSAQSPSGPFSRSSLSSPIDIQKDVKTVKDIARPPRLSKSNGGTSKMNHKQTSIHKKLMNQYFCVGTQRIAVENSIRCAHPSQSYKQSVL